MRIVPLVVILSFLTLQVLGQEAVAPRPSPTAIVTVKYEDTYLKVTYSQPHKRDRAVFGELVPYGEVWRTGANEATELTVTEDIEINGNRLKAGTYSLFSIPGEKEWTIILNSELGQWGSYNYNEASDVLRFNVPVQALENVVWEPFTIAFEQNNEKAEMRLMWDRTMVAIPIQFLDH
ncbi:DUF2911 domain-containing protein [Fulvivirga sedimenti]|uniref:DUF2911 domain-containing protein n=1 Tax=Fulvivirga sedimenti TaxID=2879465 RepID=A0A9X1HSP5_9BACT|nr:DUF2911 domain-containing protein [Fulvivirga sedimenti]MCA6074930.1 DUF2911 domain-containing protein [Fulvivirga sedimenti]MCA6076107.1 DUF2911 domain-containing protein [Fulvivirga sedimenti]MCA6077235.1 DUF2911 domain-containing protein [Fulvivirga sedimenti]